MKNESSKDRVIQIGEPMNIGENITKLRKLKNISQKDMVALLQLQGIEVSIYSYNRIEKGTQNPTVSVLLGCCKVLACDMNAIFDFHPSE